MKSIKRAHYTLGDSHSLQSYFFTQQRFNVHNVSTYMCDFRTGRRYLKVLPDVMKEHCRRFLLSQKPPQSTQSRQETIKGPLPTVLVKKDSEIRVSRAY